MVMIPEKKFDIALTRCYNTVMDKGKFNSAADTNKSAEYIKLH